jgi:hypothetical protein
VRLPGYVRDPRCLPNLRFPLWNNQCVQRVRPHRVEIELVGHGPSSTGTSPNDANSPSSNRSTRTPAPSPLPAPPPFSIGRRHVNSCPQGPTCLPDSPSRQQCERGRQSSALLASDICFLRIFQGLSVLDHDPKRRLISSARGARAWGPRQRDATASGPPRLTVVGGDSGCVAVLDLGEQQCHGATSG